MSQSRPQRASPNWAEGLRADFRDEEQRRRRRDHARNDLVDGPSHTSTLLVQGILTRRPRFLPLYRILRS